MIKIISIRAIRHKNGDPRLDPVTDINEIVSNEDFEQRSRELKAESRKRNGDKFEEHQLTYQEIT